MPKVKSIPKLTMKQKAFADALIENKGNGTKAALLAYDTTDKVTAGSISHENLRKPQVIAYLDNKWAKAGSNIEKIANDPKVSANTRLDANKYIYDHAHGKATQKVEGGLDVNLTIKVVKYGEQE